MHFLHPHLPLATPRQNPCARPAGSCRRFLVAGLLITLGCSDPGGARPGVPPGEGSSMPDGADIERNQEPASGPYDVLIAGARVVDGTGAPALDASVLLKDGVVAWVGTVDADTLEVAETIDAAGRVLAPGFIDGHAHWDLPEPPEFLNFLAQGVTTIVLGQDGRSPEVGRLAAHMDRVEGTGPALNAAWMVGHNTVRMESGVGFGVADEAGRARMASLVEQGMEAGAFGLTLGLEYDPGIRADMEELVAAAGPVADHGGVVMSHMRNEDADRVETSLAELLEQGRRAGVKVHASHLKVVLGDDQAQARRMLAMMADARASGVQATADLYPYTASFTGLSILFPEWARPPNDYAAVVVGRREELSDHLRGRVEARNGPGATLFATGPHAGRTLAEAAETTGRPFQEILVDLGPSGARAAYFVMDEDMMATFLRDPFVSISSDGGPSMAHPRGYGTFARILSLHVRDNGLISLEEAVRKMTGLTASILGLDDPSRVDVPRGLIRQGFAADLALFDPASVQDLADFENPARIAEGMDIVWVNGTVAWRDGAPVAGSAGGRVLRSRPALGAVPPPSP